MCFTDHISDTELLTTYTLSTQTQPSWEIKRKWGIRCTQVALLREIHARGILLRGGDDVILDYKDDHTWKTSDWLEYTLSLGIQCACGCGMPILVTADSRFRGLSKYLKNHRNRGRTYTAERCANISASLQGVHKSDEFKLKRKNIMDSRWKDPVYQQEQSQRMTDANADPVVREKHRVAILDWLSKNPEHLVKISHATRAWAKANPQKKIDAAKQGHKALSARKGQSSIERALSDALQAEGVTFTPEWKYLLGVADFKVGNIIVFADGNYWHGPKFPKQQAKDYRQTEYLTSQGFQVLRFTETQIQTDVCACVQQIINVSSSN